MRLSQQFRSLFNNASIRADAGLGIVGSPSPSDDYFYHSLGQRSAAGPTVSAASAMRLAAVFACARVCSETIGSLPVSIYREKKSGGREPATDHPAQDLLLNPNPWQTGMEFFEMIQGHCELRGNAYALKVSGGGRAIDQLIPLHPDRVRVYLLPNNRVRYEVTAYSTGQIDRYTQDEIVHLRAWSSDGVMGMSTVSAAAEVIGVGLAQQNHRARYFGNSAIPGMAVETTKLTTEATEELKQSLREGFSGEHSFKAMIVPPGMTVKPLGLTNVDSQLIEASGATRIEIAGMWRVPPHKIGDLSKGTFSNIEQQNIEFATDCVRPRIVRLERRLDRDVVNSLGAFESASGDFFVTFAMDALFRGDMKSRYEAYSQAINAGWMVRNESRAAEGLNPIAGLDEPLQAVNMETVKQAQQRSDNATVTAASTANISQTEEDESDAGGSPETPDNDGPAEDAQNASADKSILRALAIASATRMVRREAKGLNALVHRGLAQKEMTGEVAAFYGTLAPLIAENLAIPLDHAAAYCQDHANRMIAAVEAVEAVKLDLSIEEIEVDGPVALAKLVMTATALGEKTL